MRTSNQETWIAVTTSPGMFSSEYAISLNLLDGSVVSFFSDKDLVKEEGGMTLLKVTLVSNHPKEKSRKVLLPNEAFETATRWAEIAA